MDVSLIPPKKEIEKEILNSLFELGGVAKLKVIYSHLETKFPDLTELDKELLVPFGEKKWTNIIRWAGANLRTRNEITSIKRGVWTLTEKGKKKFISD